MGLEYQSPSLPPRLAGSGTQWPPLGACAAPISPETIHSAALTRTMLASYVGTMAGDAQGVAGLPRRGSDWVDAPPWVALLRGNEWVEGLVAREAFGPLIWA